MTISVFNGQSLIAVLNETLKVAGVYPMLKFTILEI